MKFLMLFLCLLLSACFQESSNNSDLNKSTGVAGSTAKSTIQSGHLITLENNYLKVFSLSTPTEPTLVNTYITQDDLRLETLYPYDSDKIMLGSNQGAIIMDHSTPASLTEISFAGHFKSCDPVIAHGNYMYVTLRDGKNCGLVSNVEGVNQLLVYDIHDITQPLLQKTIELNKPYGLGIKGDSLFICYIEGVYEFDITDPISPIEIGNYSQQCNDIIASNPMILTGDEGIYLVQDDDPGLTEMAIIRKGE